VRGPSIKETGRGETCIMVGYNLEHSPRLCRVFAPVRDSRPDMASTQFFSDSLVPEP
jgi:hypothetical protein